MFIIDVIPLAFLPRNQAQILSYFCNTRLRRGSLVEVEIRKRKIKAIVFDCHPIKQLKIELKKFSNFQLRKINEVIADNFICENQFDIAKWISDYYFSPLGLTLKSILPKWMFAKKYQKSPLIFKQATNQLGEVKQENIFNPDIEKYQKIVNSTNGQVLLLVPEVSCVENLKDYFTEIPKVFLSSQEKNKDQIEAWKKINDGQAKLIIGTRMALFAPFENLKCIIVDDSENEGYLSDMTPKYDSVKVAEYLANQFGARLVFGNHVPGVKFPDFDQAKTKDEKLSLIDMVKEIKFRNFSIFSQELKDEIFKNYNSRKSILLFVGRRGYAPYIFCDKCGKVIKCEDCGTSMVCHKTDKSILLCHHCLKEKEIPKLCPSCNHYKLKPQGVGIQKVVEELRKLLPEVKILRIDSDTVKDSKQINQALENHNKSNPYSIIIATQMILSHKNLIEPDLVGVIDADALINIPDYRAEEKVFRQLWLLKDLAREKIIIQSHNLGKKSVSSLRQGQKEFISEEIETRKLFNYPPFSQLIFLEYKWPNPIQAKVRADALAKNLKDIIESSGGSISEAYSPSVAKEKGKYVKNIMIKWPIFSVSNNQELEKRNKVLSLIPPDWNIRIEN